MTTMRAVAARLSARGRPLGAAAEAGEVVPEGGRARHTSPGSGMGVFATLDQRISTRFATQPMELAESIGGTRRGATSHRLSTSGDGGVSQRRKRRARRIGCPAGPAWC